MLYSICYKQNAIETDSLHSNTNAGLYTNRDMKRYTEISNKIKKYTLYSVIKDSI